MKHDELDKTFDPTPRMFSGRVDNVLKTLAEEEPAQRSPLRTALIVLPVAMLLCSAALAVAAYQGQGHMMDKHLSAWQESGPGKQEAFLSQPEIGNMQEPGKDALGLAEVKVRKYAWDTAKKLFTLELEARVMDPTRYELYSLLDMDMDGKWAPAPGEDNPLMLPQDPKTEDSRSEHWLRTIKGFGPPAEVMKDPSKALLLADIGGFPLYIGDSTVELGPERQWMGFSQEDGAVTARIEYKLDRLYEEPAAAIEDEYGYSILHPGEKNEDIAKLTRALYDLQYYHGSMSVNYSSEVRDAVMAFQHEHDLVSDGVAGTATLALLYKLHEKYELSKALEQYTDDEGVLSLRLSYRLLSFADNSFQWISQGSVTFKVKTR